MRRQALGRTCPPWPSALLCGQPSARWARGKLGLASAGQARRAELEPLAQEAAQSAPALPTPGPAPCSATITLVGEALIPGSPDPPQAGPGRRGKGGRGAGRGLGVSRACSVSHPSAMALWATTVCLIF